MRPSPLMTSNPASAPNRAAGAAIARGAILACTFWLLAIPAASARDQDAPFQDFHFSGTLGLEYTSGNYGTARNTNVQIAMPTLSVETGDFKFSASMPYMRIAGRGLVVFDAAGNPIVINRNTTLPRDVRTGWGDVNLSATYTLPSAVLDDFEVKLTGVTKLPTAPARRKLNTGETDFGMSVDVSRNFGIWGPFVTVGYLIPGKPSAYQLYNTASVSAGTTLELSADLVAVASYDFDSASTPLVPASHELFGSLSWVREDSITLTGYGTAGLSSGSPTIGAGLLISYGFN